jgi:FAD/FMN-containing dehydrogenase
VGNGRLVRSIPSLTLHHPDLNLQSIPVSNLPQLVAETKKDLDSIGLTSTIVGHVGDGNFHALILFENDDEFAKAKGAVDRMVWRAIALDGTCKPFFPPNF